MNKNTKIPNWVFTLLLVVLPALIIYIFTSPEIRNNKYVISYNGMIFVALGYLIFEFSMIAILIYLKVVDFKYINSNIPLTFCFIIIYLSFPLNQNLIWLRVILVITSIFSVIPTLFLTGWLIKRKRKNISNIKRKNTLK